MSITPRELFIVATVGLAGVAAAAPTTQDQPPKSVEQQKTELRISSAYACGLIDAQPDYNVKRPRACDEYREIARQNGVTIPAMRTEPAPLRPGSEP